ncbi:MAG: DUF6436 domain-containing protein [Spirochaetia bacterium]|nr:DUF6436 domain-containing protein [Spirochaetia bacterium]
MKIYVALPVVAFWLTGTVYAFWFFQFRNLQSFSEGAGQNFYEETLVRNFKNPAVKNFVKGFSADVLVIHYIDERCLCSKFTRSHVESLKNQYKNKNIVFIDALTYRTESISRENLAREIKDVLKLDHLPATPAVAVFSGEGSLAYFGPYSDDAVCGSSGNSFAESSINRVLSGNKITDINMLAFGCFCRNQQEIYI